MFARTTNRIATRRFGPRRIGLAAALLLALGGLAPALGQSTSTAAADSIAKPTAPTAPTPPTMPGSTAGGATHGHAMAGSEGVEFKTEAEAKEHCPADKLVWANLTSKAYHLSGDKFYGSGKTKRGAYMCQTDADANGFHKSGSRHSGGSRNAAK